MPFRYARLEGMSATAVVAIDDGVQRWPNAAGQISFTYDTTNT